jgi:hypothetical protein
MNTYMNIFVKKILNMINIVIGIKLMDARLFKVVKMPHIIYQAINNVLLC